MDEWLTVAGLHPAETNVIQELQRLADHGWEIFRHNALFYFEAMPEVIISAVNKARQQGKCRCWPD